jgi:hypothetical protein
MKGESTKPEFTAPPGVLSYSGPEPSGNKHQASLAQNWYPLAVVGTFPLAIGIYFMCDKPSEMLAIVLIVAVTLANFLGIMLGACRLQESRSALIAGWSAIAANLLAMIVMVLTIFYALTHR